MNGHIREIWKKEKLFKLNDTVISNQRAVNFKRINMKNAKLASLLSHKQAIVRK